jgi:hypothetical protein
VWDFRFSASLNFRFFWDVAPCSHVEVDRHFRGAYCLHQCSDDGGSYVPLKCRSTLWLHGATSQKTRNFNSLTVEHFLLHQHLYVIKHFIQILNMLTKDGRVCTVCHWPFQSRKNCKLQAGIFQAKQCATVCSILDIQGIVIRGLMWFCCLFHRIWVWKGRGEYWTPFKVQFSKRMRRWLGSIRVACNLLWKTNPTKRRSTLSRQIIQLWRKSG